MQLYEMISKQTMHLQVNKGLDLTGRKSIRVFTYRSAATK